MHQTSDDNIVIVEVGPRDGLQNEAAIVSTDVKIELVKRLARAGLHHIEATAFVSPKWVPQMADSTDVMRACASAAELSHVTLSALTPNLKGFEAAIAAGSRKVAVFASASETFSRRNINCSIDDSFTRFEPIFEAARAVGIPVRGYVSCVIACPYEGAIDPRAVARVSRLLLEKGAREVSLGDTIGVGTPAKVKRMLEAVAAEAPLSALAGHFHDTYGMGIANIQAALDAGIRVFDSSIAGLGGCPYAAGAAGNVATEEVVYLLQDLGLCRDINLHRLAETAAWISHITGRTDVSRVTKALMGCAKN
ncbi:hydroxymethylglutaryl-CoA lyase [Agrobacterium vitis]|uniref:hydroxymethylglutaryl-CoA lyase n=1 Tax=Allorhizobium ampelinum TaxID=3025782 RepID=UPI001F25DBAD|nr:hydroxymethylglutaryl-CoA lyase [Allorhizobium ampelinum]MCF1464301.1 hydroxymethylglutaryl-CoA lyase [Allorhizobium ampelinum]